MYIYFFIIINNRVITLLYALKSFIFVVARALLLLFCLFGLALFCLSFFLLSLELFTDSCIFPTNYEIFCMKIKSCTCNYAPMFLIL